MYPAAERRLDLVDGRLPDDEAASSRTVSAGPRPPVDRRPTSSGSRTTCASAGARELDARRPRGRCRARPVPARPAARLRGAAAGDRRARARRGRDRAARVRRGRPRVVVAFPHRGEALRAQICCAGSRRASSTTSRRCRPRPRPCSWSARRAAASSGASSGSRCCPTRRSSASRRPAPTRGSAGRSSPSPISAPATTSSTRTTASGGCSASRRGGRRESPATTCSSLPRRGSLYVPHEQIGKVSRYIGADAKAPSLSKLGGKAWLNLKSRARAAFASWPASCSRCMRSASSAGHRLDSRTTGSSGSRRRSRIARPRTSGGDRGGQGGPRGAEADGPARLWRRRLRKDGGCSAGVFRSGVNGKQTLDALPDDRPRRAALEHLPRALSRLPGPRRDGLPLPQAGRTSSGSSPTSPTGKVDVLIGTHRVLSRDVIPRQLGLVIVDEEQRFGVAQKELLCFAPAEVSMCWRRRRL